MLSIKLWTIDEIIRVEENREQTYWNYSFEGWHAQENRLIMSDIKNHNLAEVPSF